MQQYLRYIFLGIVIMTLLAVSVTATPDPSYTISYNWNELKSNDITDALAYSWGYDDGYEDYQNGKMSQPNTLVSKYMRVPETDPDRLGSELAYKEKGMYTKGYRNGFADAKAKKQREVADDFLYDYTEYGITINTIEEEMPVPELRSVTTYGTWNIDTIDTSQGVENLAYSVGCDDATQGNSKTPLKLMYDLAKDENTKVRAVYEWIRESRGIFSTKYKEGYEYCMAETTTDIGDLSTPSGDPSQQSPADQEKAAYDLGYKIGYATATAGEPSAPQTMDNYDYVISAQYSDQENEANSYSWYTLPIIAGIEISRTDVEVFHADETAYLKGYRDGYEFAQTEMTGEDKEMTDAEYVWEIGCELGETGGNPYTYNWLQRAWARTPEELDMVRLVRYNRGELLKGYRACKV